MSKELIERLRSNFPTTQAQREAADRIEQLEADYHSACQTIAEMHAAAMGAVVGTRRWLVEGIADLRAERNELKADAMRYRWLRDNKAHNNTHCWHFQHGLVIPGLLTLDAAIDAAITKGEKNAQA